MELKKNPKYDFESKRGMFFNIGLILSISLVIAAFEWKTEEVVIDFTPQDIFEEELIDILPTEFAKPEPPKPKPVIPEVVVEAESGEIIEEIPIEFPDFDDEEIIDEMPDEDGEGDEDVIVDSVFFISEISPVPRKGMKGFYKFIGKNMNYPQVAERLGIEGRVLIQFVVDKDGSLTNIKAIKGIGGGCEEEAIRVLKKAPKWKPGKQRGRPVKVRMVVPIVFALD